MLRLEIGAQYHADGVYPLTVSAMDPWGNPLNYEVPAAPAALSEGFVLFSSGPDSRPGTPDDIH